MDVEDENISTLMAMGFPDIGEIKRALRLAKNDLNEAVAILTNDQSVSSYGPVADLNIDVDMKDVAGLSKGSSEEASVAESGTDGFPETHLYELESRVFTDQWSIPYKKDESLHKCLAAATKLIEEGFGENDENMQRFLNKCMPEAFRKLLNSGAVQRWNSEIQKGIFNMLELFIDLLVVRMKHKPVPVQMLNQVFALACDLDCEWNCKNKSQHSEEKHWEDLFGQGEIFARSPENFNQDPYGWLVDLLNHFGAKNGFGIIQDSFEEDLDPVSMAAILRPLGNCAELLNPSAVCPMLTKCLEQALNHVTKLDDKDLKNKDIGAVLELLVALKLLCKCLWPDLADRMNNIRLEVILRMLKTPHFSTRMNALKEVSKLVEEAESTSPKKSSIPGDQLAEWMSDHQVLSVALEGNIDHVQYTDRIKGLVEFLGPRLSSDELSQIWAMGEKSFHVVDNLHSVLAAAAPKLAPAQLDHLLLLVQEKWQRNSNDRMREKLLSFLGQLGKECRVSKTGSKILETLWDLARCTGLPCHLVERALDEHLSVLAEIPNKEQLRKTYVLRCIDDLKKGNQGTLPLLRHLLNVARSMVKGSGTYHKPDKTALAEWNTNHEIVKLLLVSLGKCHLQAVASAKTLCKSLTQETIVDSRYGYRHGQLVQAHLDLLQMLLKEADLYLPWARCKEMWDILVTNPDGCEADRECCYQWFASCLGDMQPDTQSALFREKILKSDPVHLTLKGFECVKTFFESVNVSDGKMRRFGTQAMVEKLDPVGTDYFWQVALESPNEDLAKEAMAHILDISYLHLAPRMKKDPAVLHRKFINDCYKRLETQVPCSKATGSTTPTIALAQLKSLAPDKKSGCLQHIRRLLELVERYISVIEESHPAPRTILPHGLSFKGEPIGLHIKTEDSKTDIDLLVHSHETVWAVKQKIASLLRLNAEQLMLVIGDRPSILGREQKSLSQLGCTDKQIWVVKSASGPGAVSGGAQLTELKENWDELPSTPSPVVGALSPDAGENEMEEAASVCTSNTSAARMSFHIEQERSLPGIVMANGGQVFTMLYQLSEINDLKIQETIRRLLHLIPTDPAVLEVLEKVASRRSAASAFSTAALFDVDVRPRPSVALNASNPSSLTPPMRASGSTVVGHAAIATSPTKSIPALSVPHRPGGLASNIRSASFRRTPHHLPVEKSDSKETVEDMLRGLLNPTAPSMSPFRVLYNLEVLSGRLMPTFFDSTAVNNSNVFKQEFLSACGLNFVSRVLRKDYFSQDVNYEIRQGCCLIALQLARFLLCGEVDEAASSMATKSQMTPSKLQLTPTKMTPTKISPMRPTTPMKIQLSPIKLQSVTTSLSFSCSPVKETSLETAKAALQVLQTLSEAEFLDMISCFVRVCWAAAAGKLYLAAAPGSSSLPNKELGGTSESGPGSNCSIPSSLPNPGRRSRQSSTGSTSSTSSCGDTDTAGLYFGICASNKELCSKDVLIACEALELLITCLEVRGTKELTAFFSFPYVKDFIIDILLGCASSEVRDKASALFFRLSQAQNQFSKHSLTQILVKAPVPLWIPSCTTRGASQRLLAQCSQYFNLRCRLLSSLSSADQRSLGLVAVSMLNDEVAWLSNFTPYSGTYSNEMEQADNALLAGHLNVVRGLLNCEGVNRKEAGKLLIPDLLNQYLFPASKLIAEGLKRSSFLSTPTNINPKCSQTESRLAAYALIIELVFECRENLEAIVKQLISMHHRFNPDLAKEFEFEPAVEGRAACNYVGLKNAGATCYMNSVIQQLLLIPGLKESLLAIDDEDSDEDTLFFQFQMVMGHLQDSKLQHYVPEKFWRCLRLRGQPVNVREQQDSFEFFTHLADSIDEHLFKIGREKLFQNTLGGVFSDQMICKECPHRYEREQIFLALNLTVKSHNLVDSLEQFVKGELLEGDNAYFCEECGVKRNTVKRMCIKTLPSTLVIQLKRFYYDWDAGRSLKFDDYFQFPWDLDMAPYTAEGIQERERTDSPSVDVTLTSSSKNRNSLTLKSTRMSSSNYELVGVVVHSGQASAGHYYSFIKERKRSDGTCRNRWLKFNDTTVEEFEMNDTTLEAECFGGTYKAKSYDTTNGFPETRQRYWNGYILFYDKVEDPTKTPRTPRKGTINSVTNSSIVTRSRSFRAVGSLSTTPNKLSSASIGCFPQRDSLSQLSELLNHGERQGLFGGKMPARVQQAVREENLRFLKSRDVYCPDYYDFIYELCQANASKDVTTSACAIPSVNLAVHFLCHTYLRIRAKESSRLSSWVDLINNYTSAFKECSLWIIDFWSGEEGTKHIKSFLLECPSRSVRHQFSRILENSLSSFFNHGGQTTEPCLIKLLESLLSMLDKDVPDNCKTCPQFFYLLSAYANMGVNQCQHLFQLGAFRKLLVFLLGADRVGQSPPSPSSSPRENHSRTTTMGQKSLAIPLPAPSPTSTLQRRWSQTQAKDFHDLHTTLATLILQCDLQDQDAEVHETDNRGKLATPSDVMAALYGQNSVFYLQELVVACCHLNNISCTSAVIRMLLYAARGKLDFSRALLRETLHQCAAVSASELKNLTQILQEILVLEDGQQFNRLQCVIDGFTDKDGQSVEGVLALIQSQQSSDSRRAYQLMKFLVSLANRLQIAKDYLLQSPCKWQWSVNWLKQKIEQSYWSPHADLSNENSNTRIFQRTTSAQVTLEEATALLTEFESSDMETETDLEFGLAQSAENDETPTTLESASKSKCRFSLGPS
ncbi:hypothetical protein GHT06_018579 [Daphnia sinensis]|uniref:Ubiquitin carboxyl-terminal hydrolase 24 n=1 Tax=Daphnia sinensis TaxID=1820382 RepID=A0AAD5L4R1_9CRUS|nr:hypothetical protein GHT06_018579 [Daphnia sinensis]